MSSYPRVASIWSFPKRCSVQPAAAEANQTLSTLRNNKPKSPSCYIVFLCLKFQFIRHTHTHTYYRYTHTYNRRHFFLSSLPPSTPSYFPLTTFLSPLLHHFLSSLSPSLLSSSRSLWSPPMLFSLCPSLFTLLSCLPPSLFLEYIGIMKTFLPMKLLDVSKVCHCGVPWSRAQ